MFEITFIGDKKYTGEYGPVIFVEGKATTDKEWVAAWFEGRKFKVTAKEIEVETVESENSAFEEMEVDQLKTLCSEKGIEFNARARKETLIKLLEGAE